MDLIQPNPTYCLDEQVRYKKPFKPTQPNPRPPPIIGDQECPIFVIVRDNEINYFLSKINMSTKDIIRD